MDDRWTTGTHQMGATQGQTRWMTQSQESLINTHHSLQNSFHSSFLCQFCNSRWPTEDSWAEHLAQSCCRGKLEAEYGPDSLACNICDTVYNSNHELLFHIGVIHRQAINFHNNTFDVQDTSEVVILKESSSIANRSSTQTVSSGRPPLITITDYEASQPGWPCVTINYVSDQDHPSHQNPGNLVSSTRSSGRVSDPMSYRRHHSSGTGSAASSESGTPRSGMFSGESSPSNQRQMDCGTDSQLADLLSYQNIQDFQLVMEENIPKGDNSQLAEVQQMSQNLENFQQNFGSLQPGQDQHFKPQNLTLDQHQNQLSDQHQNQLLNQHHILPLNQDQNPSYNQDIDPDIEEVLEVVRRQMNYPSYHQY